MKKVKTNRIKHHKHYTYSSGSAFLANLTPPNKQSFKVKSEFNSFDHIPNSNK